MSVFNHLTVVGNVTRDSELRNFKKRNGDESSVVSLTVAVNRKFGDKESTVFLDVEYFGKDVSFLKGQRVLVEGELVDGSYETKDGNKVNKVKVVAVGVYDFSSGKKVAVEQKPVVKQAKKQAVVEEVDDDDVPL